MKRLWPITALLSAILAGCQLNHQQADLLHQQIFGLGGWSNYDTRGWLVGFGHVTRATHTLNAVDLLSVTNTATQVTILISPGPLVLPPAAVKMWATNF